MTNLIHVATFNFPGGGPGYFGMKHVPEYREEITGYEILNTNTGAACDVCGEPITQCSKNRTMHTPDKTTVFSISRDGEKLTTVTGEFELMQWFHRRHSYSMHHAVTYEGYVITDPNGNDVLV